MKLYGEGPTAEDSHDTLCPSESSAEKYPPHPQPLSRVGAREADSREIAASDKEPEVLIFSSAPHFSLRSQSAVLPVCKKDLGYVKVFVDLLQAGPDAVEVFFRGNLADGVAFQRATHAFLEEHHSEDDQ